MVGCSSDASRQAVATFRFEVIAPLVVRKLGPGERAHLVRDLAARLWKTPDGRTVLQIIRFIELEGLAEPGTIKRTTLSEALCRAGVSRAEVTRNKQTFQLRESPYPNAMWQLDACQLLYLPDDHGRRRTIHLVAALDDYSRHVIARLYPAEDRPALADLLKRAIIARGKPEKLYSDNGSANRSDMLATACAKLGIAPRHTRPYRPMGRGKLERYFRTVEMQWGREAQALIDAGRLKTLDDCQQFFAAWLHSEYNARVHSSTHETPDARLAHVHPEHPIVWVDPLLLADAFLWLETRTVTAVGTVSIEGRDFEVAPELARRRITVRYDPYDLLWQAFHKRSYG